MPDKMNAGTVYLTVYCDETGSQNEFQKVFNETKNFINSEHKDKLRILPNDSCLNFNLKGNGSYWFISLPEIKSYKQLPYSRQSFIQLPMTF